MAVSFSRRLWQLARLAGLFLVLAGCLDSDGAGAAGLVNGDFSQGEGGSPTGWHISEAAAAKGGAVVEGGMLVLSPDAANTPSAEPLGFGQIIDVASFRGGTLVLSAQLGAEGGAAAIVGLAVLDKGGAVKRMLSLRAASGEGGPAEREARDTGPLPDSAETMILFASAEGTQGRAIFDDIRLTVLAPEPAGAASATPTVFTLDPGAGGRPLPVSVFGANVEWIRSANGLWNADAQAIDSDFIRMARAAGISLIRFPGGVWSDTYDWRQGIGPQGSRPASAHIPGQDERSPHVIGTDEIAAFARGIGAKLMITVNAGHGTPEEAGAWAAYIRDKHGADIATWWEIGNELYMANDLSGASMTPAEYVAKVRPFAEAIRRELPDARIAAIGLLNYGPYRFNAYDDWNETVLAMAGDTIDSFAIHNAYAPLVIDSSPEVWAEVYRALLAAPALVADNLADTAAQLDRYQPDRSGQIGIAVTEWGPLFTLDPTNPYFDHIKTQAAAVGVARMLNTFLREPRVEAAAFFKLSDWLNMGWIGPVRGGGWRETPALLAFGLYRPTLGDELIPLDRESGPVFFSSPRGFTGGVEAAPLVDGVAGRRANGTLGLMLNNADLAGPQPVTVRIGGPGKYVAHVTHLAGPAPDAHRGTIHIDVPGVPFAPPGNFAPGDWFRKSEADTVGLSSEPPSTVKGEFSIVLPPTSVTAIRMEPAP